MNASNFRRAIEALRGGNREPFDRAMAEFRQVIEEVGNAETHEALCASLANHAIRTKDLEMLRTVLDLPVEFSYQEQTLAAAVLCWVEGFTELRKRNQGLPLHGITLIGAFLMRDPSAFPATDAHGQLREQVRAFVLVIRDRGQSLDDAIDFLYEVGLAEFVDYALGLADEFGMLPPPGDPDGD